MDKKRMSPAGDPIDLMELMYTFLRKWWLIALCSVSGAIIAMAVTMCLMAPQYESKAMLYILNKTTTITSIADLQLGTALSEDFPIIAKSKPVLDKVIETIEEEEGKTFTREAIQGMTTISSQSRIITVRVVSENAEDACIIANAMAEAISDQVAEIMKSVPPTMVEKAEVSHTPVGPDVKRNTMKGFLAGLALICGVLTLLVLLNDRIKTQEDVEKYLDTVTLAVIPYTTEKERKKENARKRSKNRYRAVR